jgi:nucleoside-diphosphate-sugar epimerase
MKIFITGATGYIGDQLLRAAIQKGHRVNALVRNAKATGLIGHELVSYAEGDVTNQDSVMKAMQGCDVVMHAAGITQLWHKDRSIFYKVNVGGTRNVLEAACVHGVKKFVYTSTCAVLGPSNHQPVSEEDPRLTAFENDYEISKHCAEELVKEYSRKGLFTVIVSPSRVYGPGRWTGGNPISKLIRNTIRRKFGLVPAAKNTLGNYAFIDDVVQGHFLAMEKGLGGEKYILGGENFSYMDFFDSIRLQSNTKLRLITVPKFILKIAGGLAYAFSLITRKHQHLTPKTVERLFQNRAVNCNKAVRQLGYQITPFQEGLQQTIQFLKSANHV